MTEEIELNGVEALAASSPLFGVLWLTLLLMSLVAIAVMCDEYLVPSLVEICEYYRIPEAAAGATIFALASAGMDIFFSCIETALGEPSVGLAYVLGAGIIAFGLIPPALVVFTPADSLKLEALPIIRDALFCLLAFGTLLGSLADNRMTAWEAGIMIVEYIGYWFAVYLPLSFCPQHPIVHDHEASRRNSEVSADLEDSSRGDKQVMEQLVEAVGTLPREDHEPPAPDGAAVTAVAMGAAGQALDLMTRGLTLATLPWKILYLRLFPSTPEMLVEKAEHGLMELEKAGQKEDKEAVAKLMKPLVRTHFNIVALSMLYMFVFTILVVHVADLMTVTFRIPADFNAAVILPFIYNFPDMWASIVMAKQGLADGAIANASGAQVANVLLGCGLPFFAYTLIHGPVVVSSSSCDPSLKYGLFIVGSTFVGLSLWSKCGSLDWSALDPTAKITFRPWQAVILLCVYVTIMVYVIIRTLPSS